MSVVQFPHKPSNPIARPFFTPQSLIDQDWDSADEESDEIDRAYSLYLRELER